MPSKLYEDVPLPFEPTWHPAPDPPHFVHEGLGVFCLGGEGEWIVSFEETTPEKFLDAVYAYELAVESYDSWQDFDDYDQDEPYGVDAVHVTACVIVPDKYGEWYLDWDAKSDTVKDRLVMVLNRW